MHFTFNHSYRDIFFNVECECTPNVLFKDMSPHIEWYVMGFKNVREIVEAAYVNSYYAPEEINLLQEEIEDLCLKIVQRTEREMLEDCLVDNYLKSELYQ